MQTAGNESNLTSKNLAVSYFVVLLAAAVLYIVTCAPGPLWQDGGMFQYRIWHNDIEGDLGLALSHPLYHIIGIGVKYIPLGEFAYRVNLISAVAAAFTIANVFLFLHIWLGKNTPAVLAAITLALSWTFWQFGSIAKDWTLYLAIFSTELIMLLQYVKTKRIGFLYMLAFFNGFAIADNMFAVFALACYLVLWAVLLMQKQITLRHIAVMIALWIMGAVPYEYLVIKNVIQTRNFAATMVSIFFGNRWEKNALNVAVSSRIIKENLIFLVYNFPTPNIIFFFAGLYGLNKVSPSRSFRNILLAILILFFIFAFRYTVPDRYAFFIPFFCLVSVLAGVGFNSVLAGLAPPYRRVLCLAVFILALLPIPVYIVAPVVVEKMHFNLFTRREIPYRNDYTWFLRPWQTGYNGPEQFAEQALSNVEKEAIIIADGTTVYPLWYVQKVKGTAPSVKIVSDHGSYENPVAFPTEETIGKLLAERAVYVVSPVAGYCPGFLLKQYKFEQKGVLWKVTN
jgi:4-amino-4-deoxy-L-arabinose transferase-like glycosyltransferase